MAFDIRFEHTKFNQMKEALTKWKEKAVVKEPIDQESNDALPQETSRDPLHPSPVCDPIVPLRDPPPLPPRKS